MPRLSLYHPQKSNDYKFMDRTISEMYTVGGLDIFVHKYMGPKTGGEDSTESDNYDATQPVYSTENPLFIQDLLLLENRDRAYDPDVYTMRGVYNVQDIDFDLSQFGLFINNDTLFITFHYNDMIDTIGRKLMNGDVLEVPNLKDYHPLDETIPRALPKYYVVQDASFASEGFSQTWQPHLWRIKATPMVDAQEYQEIINKPFVSEQIWDNGNFYPRGSIVNFGDKYYQSKQDTPVGIEITNTNYWNETEPTKEEKFVGARTKDTEINDAILLQSQIEVPKSGYDSVKFYIYPTTDAGLPQDPVGIDVDSTTPTVDDNGITSDTGAATPTTDGYTLGYLTGDDIAPNGLAVTPGVAFPLSPKEGEYALRLDYYPNRLFRYNGKSWTRMEDGVRTDLTNGANNKTLRSSFVNNTATVQTTDRDTIPSRQSLSDLLKPKADNGG